MTTRKHELDEAEQSLGLPPIEDQVDAMTQAFLAKLEALPVPFDVYADAVCTALNIVAERYTLVRDEQKSQGGDD